MAEPVVHAQGPNARSPSAISSRSNSSPVADFLAENALIGCDLQYNKCYRPRYIYLKMPQMFGALVSLYTNIFAMYWQRFRSFMDAFPLPENYQGNPQGYASAVYISSWFLDLYVSNREACHKLSYTAYRKIYHLDIFHRSEDYDAYLVNLNSTIRPTIIQLNGEATLFIPRFELAEDLQDENYFNIQGWVINDPCLFGLIHIFQERELVKIEKLNSISTGRASWLFDWHDNDKAYAWFAAEGNYDLDDVAVVYILGVSCTPKLGPCDYDEWQYYPDNVFPAEANLARYERVRAITYYGAVKKRIIESEPWAIPDHLLDLLSIEPKAVTIRPRQKRSRMEEFEPQKAVDGGGESTIVRLSSTPTLTGVQATEHTIVAPSITRYRLVDYVYHAQVIFRTDIHSRQAALGMMLRPQSGLTF